MGEYTQTVAELQALSFDFGMESYPIFDESYRAGLNAKILDFYKYHEIGEEDTTIFKHNLNSALNEIMPLHNQFYESAALSYNPLLTFSRNESTSTSNTVSSTGTQAGTQARTGNISETGTTENATNSANKTTGKEISSDTPQGLLAAGDIDGNVWASNARLTENNSTDTGTNDTETNIDRTETDAISTTGENESTTAGTGTTTGTQTGYERPLAELVQTHRETFMNIDMKVIFDLRHCFMMIY